MSRVSVVKASPEARRAIEIWRLVYPGVKSVMKWGGAGNEEEREREERERGGTAAAVPLPFRPSEPALCGSCPLVTPY